jgi:hypothetical protein
MSCSKVVLGAIKSVENGTIYASRISPDVLIKVNHFEQNGKATFFL